MEYQVKGLEEFTPEELEQVEQADRIFRQTARELGPDPESIDGLVGGAEFVLGEQKGTIISCVPGSWLSGEN